MTTQITIQHTPGCPNAAIARARVDTAVGQLDGPVPAVSLEEIADPGEATRRGFVGSPALLFDGVDVFATAGTAPAFACRTYDTDSGADGAPSVGQILAVLTSHRAG